MDKIFEILKNNKNKKGGIINNEWKEIDKWLEELLFEDSCDENKIK